MKKLTALFVMLVMMFTMAACGDGSSSNTTTTGNNPNNTPTSENAEAIYNAAEAAMAQVKDYTLKTTIKSSAVLGEETTDVTVTTTTLVDIAGKKLLATTSDYVAYYDADVYMVDMGSEGAKLKAAMDAETLAALVAGNSATTGMYFSDFAKCTVEKSGSDYVLTVKGLNNADALATLASGLTEDMVNAEIDLANFEMTMVISNNQYKSVSIKLAMNVNMDKVNMDPISSTYEIKYEFSDIGSTASKIAKPSEDGYVDTDLSLILGL